MNYTAIFFDTATKLFNYIRVILLKNFFYFFKLVSFCDVNYKLSNASSGYLFYK